LARVFFAVPAGAAVTPLGAALAVYFLHWRLLPGLASGFVMGAIASVVAPGPWFALGLLTSMAAFVGIGAGVAAVGIHSMSSEGKHASTRSQAYCGVSSGVLAIVFAALGFAHWGNLSFSHPSVFAWLAYFAVVSGGAGGLYGCLLDNL
jgi:hypothetical protein